MDLSLRKKLSCILFTLTLCIAVWPYVLFASPTAEVILSSDAAVIFSDVKPDATYAGALQELVSAGIVTGYPDGTFRPDQEISVQEFGFLLSRAHLTKPGRIAPVRNKTQCSDAFLTLPQAVTLLLQEMGVPHNLSLAGLPDLPENLHARIQGTEGEMYLSAAFHYGILDQTTLMSFDPAASITRAEAISFLYHATAVQDLTLPLPTHMYDIPVTFQGEKAASFVYDIASGLSCFTEDVLSAYAASGASITVTDEDPDRYYRSNVDIRGMYWPGSCDIILFSNGRHASLFYALTGTMRHEMGHYIYDALLSASDRTAIQKAFHSDESFSFAQASFQDKAENASEYFAELITYLARCGRSPACESFASSTEIALKYLAYAQ